MSRDQAKPYVEALVKRVLASWTGYQLALANQSAGGETKALNLLLHDELALLLLETKDLDKYVIEDWLDDAFNDTFNLVLEDGSVSEMSDILAQATHLILKGKLEEAQSLVNRLPDESTVNQAKEQSRTVADEEDEQAENSDDGEEMETEEPAKTRKPRTQIEEDGWTTVLSSKK
uniref:Pre-rRNA-processing protein TSR2 homolog n=1 Tax=Bursaphelenchus xylophilus TaxID=6326 RepID=A0A1I7RHE2_BURXY